MWRVGTKIKILVPDIIESLRATGLKSPAAIRLNMKWVGTVAAVAIIVSTFWIKD